LKYIQGWMGKDRFWVSSGDRISKLLANEKEVQTLLDKAFEATKTAFNDDFTFVLYGARNDGRVVRASEVEVVEAPAPKPIVAKVEPALTKRKQMVIGSKWKFTEDLIIKAWVSNPEINRLVAERDRVSVSPNIQTRQGGTVYITRNPAYTAASEIPVKAIQEKINKVLKDAPQVEIDFYKIKAGTEIEIVGKLTASGDYNYGGKKQSNGLVVPANVIPGTGRIEHFSKDKLVYVRAEVTLPYKQIENFVEATDIPEVLTYIIRDTKTGAYFGGWETEDNGRYNRSTDTPKYSTTISGAKKYTNVSAVKASIRDMTGYNSGIENNENEEAYYVFAGGEKKIDLPEGWEIAVVNKATREIKGDPIDLQNWYKGLMRLRDLTVKYGSAVRAVFKKAESKGAEAILVLKTEDAFEDGDNADAKERFRALEKSFAGKMFTHTGKASVAYAGSLDDAMLGKMMFRPKEGETATLLDFNTLEEIVGSETTTV